MRSGREEGGEDRRQPREQGNERFRRSGRRGREISGAFFFLISSLSLVSPLSLLLPLCRCFALIYIILVLFRSSASRRGACLSLGQIGRAHV